MSHEDPRGIRIENVADNLKQNQQFASVLKLLFLELPLR